MQQSWLIAGASIFALQIIKQQQPPRICDTLATMKSFVAHIRRLSAASPPAAPAGADIISRLPVELHILILDLFQPDELLPALNVCRTWRSIWLSDDLWPSLADRWFPGLSACMRATVTAGQNEGEMFRRAMLKARRRASGRYASAIHHGMWLDSDKMFRTSSRAHYSPEKYPEIEPDQPRYARFMMYSNGRIAWWPEAYGLPYLAVVDDFRNRSRRLYQFPNHRGEKQGYKMAMGDKLLLIGREQTLHAWHLEFDRQEDSIFLPESFERCITEGETVLIVSRNANVYIWKFGRSIQQVDMARAGCYPMGPVRMGMVDDFPPDQFSINRIGLHLRQTGTALDFIIHPAVAGVFFVVTFHEGHLIVHEFDHGELVGSFHMGDEALADRWASIRASLHFEKCDSYGGYALLSTWVRSSDRLRPRDLQEPRHPACVCDHESNTGLVSICFNIYTKTFRTICHHLLSDETAAFHIWNNQLSTSYSPELKEAGWPVMALRSCIDINKEPQTFENPIPLYTTPNRPPPRVLVRRHRMYLRPMMLGWVENERNEIVLRRVVEFGLDANQKWAQRAVSRGGPADRPYTQQHGVQRLLGDDDFLVYVDDQVYTAWSFGDEVPDDRGSNLWTTS